MARMARRLRLLTVTAVVALSIGAFAGPAAASGLTVILPCGCTALSQQPVGVAPNTPAAENPSGVAILAR